MVPTLVPPPLLAIEDLRVSIEVGDTHISPVDGVTLEVERGEFLGIAGESGAGKSLTLRAIVGLLPPGSRTDGKLLFSFTGEVPEARAVEDVRGDGVAMVFQEPMTALNPTMRVGDLVAEAPRVHRGLGRADARARAVELMGLVGIPDPERRARLWPHQLSGGLRQRVMIAAALSTDPKLLLCDEPTTALDVTVQDQILGLIDRLREELGMSVVWVTHDLAVIAEVCDRLAVMYAGRIVELGAVDDVLRSPRHPYTSALLDAAPSFHGGSERMVGIGGRPPDPRAFPEGCRFAPRCRFARADCTEAPYELAAVHGRLTACIHPEVLDEPGP